MNNCIKTCVLSLGLLPTQALADIACNSIAVNAPFARAATPFAKAGAAYLTIENSGETSAFLVAAQSEIASRVEFHTHSMTDGVMSMGQIEGDIEIASGAQFSFVRGGDHLMLMGLTQSLTQGVTFDLTLSFRDCPEIEVTVEVDLERE